MALLRWDPKEDLLSFRDEMMRLMEEGMLPQRMMQMFSPGGRMMRVPMDAYETDEEIVILASIPGVAPENVEITFEGETLMIKGEIQTPDEELDYIFRERPSGEFSRALVVNVPVNADEASATFENGLLTLTLPKAEEIRPKVIKVNVT